MPSRQCAAKNVANETRVGRPVRAEFKFHHDAGCDADGKRQREHFRPEARQLVVEIVAGAQPRAFHQHKHDGEANAQRRKKIMKRDGRAELYSRQSQDIHKTKCIEPAVSVW
jgi:hypothetical protein